MTTTLSLREAPAAVAELDAVAVLAGELLAEHAQAGTWAAELDGDDPALWAAVRPLLARLSRVGRQAAGEIAAARGRALPGGGVQALTERDDAPPIVWAREIGAMHQVLQRALRGIEQDGDAHIPAVLTDALRRTKAVAAEVKAVAGAA